MLQKHSLIRVYQYTLYDIILTTELIKKQREEDVFTKLSPVAQINDKDDDDKVSSEEDVEVKYIGKVYGVLHCKKYLVLF